MCPIPASWEVILATAHYWFGFGVTVSQNTHNITWRCYLFMNFFIYVFSYKKSSSDAFEGKDLLRFP